MQLLNKFYMRLASGGLIDSYGELGLILGAFPPLILVRFWGSKRVGNTIEDPTRRMLLEASIQFAVFNASVFSPWKAITHFWW